MVGVRYDCPMRTSRSTAFVALAIAPAALMAACGLDAVGTLASDAGPVGERTDGAAVDAGTVDVGTVDEGIVDVGTVDEGIVDVGIVDVGIVDGGTVDGAEAGALTALSFDGVDDFVRVLRQVQDDFTLEAWMSTVTSRSGSNFYDGLGVVYADVPGSASDFGTSIVNGKLAFGTVDNTILSTTTVTSGAWVHMAAVRVRSTGTMRVVINGVEESATSGNSTATLTASATIDIGGNTIDGRYFKGKLDEVRVWNVARTAAQIAGMMSMRLTGSEAGLVGYWRFDDGAGTVAIDSSPSANHGALGNGVAASRPTWSPSDAF